MSAVETSNPSMTLKALEELEASTSQLLRHQLSCAEGLRVHEEYFNGGRAQLNTIRRVVRHYAAYVHALQQGPAQSPPLLRVLQDAYSLSPKNTHLRPCLMKVLESVAPRSLEELRSTLKQRTVLHISCWPRVARARASFLSFLPFPDDEAHIIVVGDPKRDNDMSFEFRGGLLRVPVSDSYERLIEKVLFAIFLIDAAGEVETLVKFDDDIRMTSREAFASLLGEIAASPNAYHGLEFAPGHHANYVHGWHLGKCTAGSVEEVGIQVPLPPRFATGAMGYFLGTEAVRSLAYAFLTQRAFHSLGTGFPEDAIIGLHLHLAGFPLAPLPLESASQCGYSGDLQGDRGEYTEFAERLRADEVRAAARPSPAAGPG
jgi:hypothetical protein